MSDEQKKAVETILASRDQFINFHGVAGSGKTTTLAEVVKNIQGSVLMTAPSTGAVEKLREDGFQEPLTTQGFLTHQKDQKALKRGVLLIDEAGLLSMKQMDEVIKIARKEEIRVILVGDIRQHNSVEAGDALRLIETYSVIEQAEVNTIRRQKTPLYREAIQALSRGAVELGMAKLEKLGALHEAEKIGQAKEVTRARDVAQEYVNHIKKWHPDFDCYPYLG